jgi:hypothetical protein
MYHDSEALLAVSSYFNFDVFRTILTPILSPIYNVQFCDCIV